VIVCLGLTIGGGCFGGSTITGGGASGGGFCSKTTIFSVGGC